MRPAATRRRRSADTISVHRLVQAVVRARREHKRGRGGRGSGPTPTVSVSQRQLGSHPLARVRAVAPAPSDCVRARAAPRIRRGTSRVAARSSLDIPAWAWPLRAGTTAGRTCRDRHRGRVGLRACRSRLAHRRA